MTETEENRRGRLRDMAEDEFAARYGCSRFTATVLSNRFGFIVEHLAGALLRTAFSPILRYSYDFAATLSGPRQTDYLTAGISNSLVLFVGPMMDAVRNTVEEYGSERIRSGDVLMCNDPYRTGTHINDLLLVKPVFHDGEILGFINIMAHQLDMGGSVPGGFSGTKTNIYENGLVISPRRLYAEGELVPESFGMILDNVRFGNVIEADLKSMHAALGLGAGLLLESADRHGAASVLGAMRYSCDAGEERITGALESLPDGVYEGEDVLDADGIDDTEEYRVKVRITKVGTHAEVDVSGSSRQARTSINATVWDAKTAVIVALKFLLDPHGAFNSGTMRPVDLLIPEGTFLSALPPEGVVMLYFEATNTLLTAIFRAFASILGPDAVAGDLGSNNIHNAAGSNPDGSQWVSASQVGGDKGPWGATRKGDGETYMATLQANVLDVSVESIESEAPVLVSRREGVIDTGGPGRHRGGAAQVKDSLWLTEATHHSMPLRFKLPSGFGVNGGRDGATGGVWMWDGADDAPLQRSLDHEVYADATAIAGRINPDTGAPASTEPYAYFASQALWSTRPMAMWRYLVNGAGGWGEPLERDPADVLVDVRDGYVSLAAARSEYGVVVRGDPDRDPEGLEVDGPATRALREAERGQG